LGVVEERRSERQREEENNKAETGRKEYNRVLDEQRGRGKKEGNLEFSPVPVK